MNEMKIICPDIQPIVEALQGFVRAVFDAADRLAEAFIQAFKSFHGVVVRLTPAPEPSPHRPPKLAAPLTSWAYYTKPQYRYKHSYRQEQLWRHRG